MKVEAFQKTRQNVCIILTTTFSFDIKKSRDFALRHTAHEF